MGKIWFMPFDDRSHSALQLSKQLHFRRIRREGSAFQGSPDKVVINWGCSVVSEEVEKCKIINPPRLVRAAANKLSFFRKVEKSTRIPPYTTGLKTVMEWLKARQLVVGRTQTNGRSGTDIVFIDNIAGIIDCPLYTQYIKKKEEYRVHIVLGEVIDVQRKVARTQDENGNAIDTSELDFRVRSHKNGFIFNRHNIHPNRDVIDQARNAYKATGLDFGAVDVIWNEAKGEAYVLEINTAPGLEGTTLDNYVSAFKSLA